MAKGRRSVIFCCLAVLLALSNEGAQAQFLPFSLSDSDNDCYVQCPMECPQLNLNMVDCVVYCKMKCACPADDKECVTKAMDKMQKAADERESAIGPEEEEAAESPESDAADILQAGASDSDAAFAPEADAPYADDEAAAGDLAFAVEDGETALSPEAMAPEIGTTTFVIEMDLSPTQSGAGAPAADVAETPESQSAAPAATPQSSAAAAAAPTPRGAAAPTSQNAASPALQKAAPAPNAPAPY